MRHLAWCDCFWPETNYTLSGMQIRARLKLFQKMAKKRAWEMFEHKAVCQTEYVAITDCFVRFSGVCSKLVNQPSVNWVSKNGDVNNHIAEHHLHTNHRIDWDSAECVTYSTDYHKRLTIENSLI